ncbi:hypothetical protein amrb99_77910 [Actinomadura sp. RB99]|nr:hypothetical protein [Actinomadura sp. RB99]
MDSFPNGGRPVAANTIVDAHANTSTAGPSSPGWSCSGAMYAGVPTARLTTVCAPDSAREIPKSMTRGPSAPSSTLCGLKSRCTTPASCSATSAVAVAIASRSRALPDRGPPSRTTALSGGPSTYSLTMKRRLPNAPESSTWAVQNRATCLAASSSRANVSCAPGSPVSCAWNSLIATRSPPPSGTAA